jgi:hypothetical protein
MYRVAAFKPTVESALTYVDPGGAKHYFQGSSLWFFDEGAAY